MSDSDKQPIQNAADIIESFGGIRPMASKIDVAVTTVQGWKKRDAIPANRREIIIKAAKEHDIDLSAFLGTEVKKQNEPSDVIAQEEKEVEVKVEDIDAVEHTPPPALTESVKPEEKAAQHAAEKPQAELKASPKPEYKPHNNFTEIAVQTERKAITKSTVIAALMLVFVLATIVAMLWPKVKKFDAHGRQISSLQTDVLALKQQQTTFKGLVPENWSEQLNSLREQAEQAKRAVDNTMHSVQGITQDLVSKQGIEHRVEQLETYVSEIAGDQRLYSLIARFEQMQKSTIGQKMLDDSMQQLSAIFANIDNADEAQINAVLDSARSKDTVLGQTFGDIPQSELKAAAMLLSLTQLRSTLNRPNESFDADLQLLLNMVGDDNVELRAALEKLAPQAKAGLLSPSGLSAEFRAITGDVVAASLRGEDVSFGDKLAAKMNDILKVEKDGELVTGTQTQGKVDRAEKMFESGQWEETLQYLTQNLNARELEPLKPWIRKVEAQLTAQNAKKAIEQAIELNLGRGFLGGSQLLNAQ